MSAPFAHPLAYLPSPSDAGVHLGPIPVRYYALCMIAGIAFAVWLGERRWRAKGGEPHVVSDIAVWAVPFGLVGARLYNVVTDPELYFPRGQDWVHVFYIWDGGLGVWGAIALGAVGAWIGARRRGVKIPPLADALAPGILFAHAIARWGNWFNNELYGGPTSKPWGLTIHCMGSGSDRVAVPCSGVPGTTTVLGTFQPTFLYESLWTTAMACLLLWLDRRYRLGHGRLFALYVMAYTAGRGWIESLRIDYAHTFFGLRLNDWTSILVFSAALAYFLISMKRRPGQETTAELYWPHFRFAEVPAEAADEAPAQSADEPEDQKPATAEAAG